MKKPGTRRLPASDQWLRGQVEPQAGTVHTGRACTAERLAPALGRELAEKRRDRLKAEIQARARPARGNDTFNALAGLQRSRSVQLRQCGVPQPLAGGGKLGRKRCLELCGDAHPAGWRVESYQCLKALIDRIVSDIANLGFELVHTRYLVTAGDPRFPRSVDKSKDRQASFNIYVGIATILSPDLHPRVGSLKKHNLSGV